MISAWMLTSSADTGSSSTMQIGLERRAPWRCRSVAAGRRRTRADSGRRIGRELDQVEQLVDPSALTVTVDSVHRATVRRSIVADRHARVERSRGILEHHLDIAPRRAQRARARAPVSSTPSNLTEPAVGSIRRSTQRPVVLLPQPDSPTRPSVSPRSTSKDTPDTACTMRRPAAARGCGAPGTALTRSRTARAALVSGMIARRRLQRPAHRQHARRLGGAERRAARVVAGAGVDRVRAARAERATRRGREHAGGVPPIGISSRSGRSRRGSDAAGRCVYGWRRSVEERATAAPTRRSRPAYITCTRRRCRRRRRGRG